MQFQVRNGEHDLILFVLVSFTVSLTQPLSGLIENLKVVSRNCHSVFWQVGEVW